MAKKDLPLNIVEEKLSMIIELLTPTEKKIILENTTIQNLRKNDIVYNNGDAPRDLMCIISGKVKVVKEGVSGRSQLLRVLKPITITGHRAFFANEVHHTTASALEPTVIIRIPLHVIADIIQVNTKLAWFFIRDLSTRLGVANERTVNLTQKHVRGRLAEAILFLRDTYGLEEDGCTLSIYLSREDMANMSNMTTSNAIRTLSAFAQEKLVAIDGRKIKLIDVAELEKISKFG